jgi:PPOX class probable F420-dependent enzyme
MTPEPLQPPESHRGLLTQPLIAHLATIRRDGTPQSNPVWFHWNGTQVELSQATTTWKLRNMRRNPAVSLSVRDPDNAFRFIEVRGQVDEIVPDVDKAFLRMLMKRYLGRTGDQFLPPEERMIVRVRPTHFAREKGYGATANA